MTDAFMVGPGEGTPAWMLNALLTTKARGSDTGGGTTTRGVVAQPETRRARRSARRIRRSW